MSMSEDNVYPESLFPYFYHSLIYSSSCGSGRGVGQWVSVFKTLLHTMGGAVFSTVASQQKGLGFDAGAFCVQFEYSSCTQA